MKRGTREHIDKTTREEIMREHIDEIMKLKERIDKIMENDKLVKMEKVSKLQDLLSEAGYKFLEIDKIIKNIMEERNEKDN